MAIKTVPGVKYLLPPEKGEIVNSWTVSMVDFVFAVEILRKTIPPVLKYPQRPLITDCSTAVTFLGCSSTLKKQLPSQFFMNGYCAKQVRWGRIIANRNARPLRNGPLILVKWFPH